MNCCSSCSQSWSSLFWGARLSYRVWCSSWMGSSCFSASFSLAPLLVWNGLVFVLILISYHHLWVKHIVEGAFTSSEDRDGCPTQLGGYESSRISFRTDEEPLSPFTTFGRGKRELARAWRVEAALALASFSSLNGYTPAADVATSFWKGRAIATCFVN